MGTSAPTMTLMAQAPINAQTWVIIGLGMMGGMHYRAWGGIDGAQMVIAVTDALPGANCGGCGYAGCSAAAEAPASSRGSAPTR